MSTNAFYNLLNEGSPVTHVYSATATLDFPSVAAGGTQALTVTVPGVAVGDIVVMSLPAAVNNGLIFDARVSDVNVVTVRALNITAAPIDPASALFNFLAFKIS